MQRVKSSLLSACIYLAAASLTSAQDTIPWLTDLRQARQAAEQQQRLVVLHFWSESCVPCRELEHNVFNQPELIRALSASFVPVKINVMQQPKLADHYKIERVPTDVIVLPNGREVSRRTSPANTNDYLAMLDQVRAQAAATAGGNPDALVSQEANRAALPPRDLGTDTQTRSEPINTDPNAFAGGPDARGPGGPASAAQRNVVRNDFVIPTASETPSQMAEVAPRYGNPYLKNSAAGKSEPNSEPSMPPQLGALKPASSTGVASPESAAPTGPNPSAPSGLSGQPTLRPGETPILGSSPLPLNPGLPPGPTFPTGNVPPTLANQGATPSGPLNPTAGTPLPTNGAPIASPGVSLPPNMPPLAMDGYCPVTLVAMTKWVKGDPRFGAVHRGRTYLLSSQAEQQRFLSDPDRYSPALSGYDPVKFAESRQLVDGRREFGVFFANSYYLFSDEAALVKFESQPHGYVQLVRQAMASSAPSQR